MGALLIYPVEAFIGAALVSRTADQGLANTLGLTTLRHGTNPLSWVAIHILGFLPSMGASKIGGDGGVHFIEQNIGRVYFARDADDYDKYPCGIIYNIISFVGKKLEMRAIPKTYAYLSTFNLYSRSLGMDPYKPNFFTALPLGILGALSFYTIAAIPTIKVRMDPIEATQLKRDESHSANTACSTDKYISPLNIGIVGTLWNGLNYKVVKRICDNPLRFAAGVIELAIAAAAVYYVVTTLPGFILANKVACVAGCLYGAI